MERAEAVIERAVDQRAKRLKTEIAVDDARDAQTFFARTSGAGGWRVAKDTKEIRAKAGMDAAWLDAAYQVCERGTANGGLLVGAAILVPIILAYTGYAYWVFRGKTGHDGYH